MRLRTLPLALTLGLAGLGPTDGRAQGLSGDYEVVAAPEPDRPALRPAKAPASPFTRLQVTQDGSDIRLEFGSEEAVTLTYAGTIDKGGITASRAGVKPGRLVEELVAQVSPDGRQIAGRLAFAADRGALQALRFEATRADRQARRYAPAAPRPTFRFPRRGLGERAYTEYYVHPEGSDAEGDGSEASPWQTLTHALAQMDLGVDFPRLNLGPGRYVESVEVTADRFPANGRRHFLAIAGTGSQDVVLAPDASDPREYVLRAVGDFALDLGHLTVESDGKVYGLQVDGARLDLHDAEFVKLAPFAIDLAHSSPFAIRRTRMRSWDVADYRWSSDNGVAVDSSAGVIEEFHASGYIDHIIDIENSDVSVRRAVLEGSPIGWADGIRAMNSALVVEDCTIGRELFPPEPRRPQHLADAAIEVIFSQPQAQTRRVHIANNALRGWRDGLYVYASEHEVLVQGNRFESNGNAYYPSDRQFAIRLQPCAICPGASSAVVDLGGGPLGSAGGNSFPPDERVLVRNELPSAVSALGNDWGTADAAAVADRIHDGADDPALGRVLTGLEAAP